MIIAVIQPFMLNKLTAELEVIGGFPGLTVTEARGFGRRIDSDGNRITEIDPYKAKMRVEIAVPDEMVEIIVETIKDFAHTGQHGDGKIFVLEVENAVRIQTGETGNQAL